MIIEAIACVTFVGMCGSLLFPEQSQKLKTVTSKAAKLTKEQMAASAYTNKGRLIKAYPSKENARKHRVRVAPGTIVCLPNGDNITIKEGLKDIESEGWWYSVGCFSDNLI